MRSLFALALAFVLTAPAFADGLIVVPPNVPDQPHLRNVPLAVKYHRVSVTVKGRVAVTEVDQVFVNPNPRRLEGTYLFPLPKNATIDRFSMWLDGKELKAELLDAGKARQIYQDIVRRQLDPALLEYAENEVFRARIFPIEPHGEKRVRISYAEVISADNGTFAYRYPLNTEKFSSRPLEDCSVKVTIEADSPIRAIFSPSHNIDAPRDAKETVTVGWEARNVKPDRDFLLYWRPTKKDVGISAVVHRAPGEDKDGTFLLVLAAGSETDQKTIAKDVIFVVDTSGSMAGQKMDQAKGALRYCLRSLNPADRFAIVPFATEPRRFRDALAPVGADTLAAAEAFVDGLEAKGGTAIADALTSSLSLIDEPPGNERPVYVLFLTDGQPTIGETDTDRILAIQGKSARKPRVFAFGVGNDVNTRLLDLLAEKNGGTRDYVTETESIEEKVSNLYAKVSHPAMTDLVLTVDGVDAAAVHPRALGDLFHGSEILVAGRYAKAGTAVVKLAGNVAGKPVQIVEELKFPETQTGNEFLPRLWGVRRVGFLLDQIRLHGETGEVKDEVVALAKRYGIVTPYTSYLILEDEASRPAGARPTLGGRTGWTGGSDSGGDDGFSGPTTGAGGGAGGPPPADAPLRERDRREAKKAGEALESESGGDAVDASKDVAGARDYEGDKDDEKRDISGRGSGAVRHVSGRSFVRRGDMWWELNVDLTKERTRIEAFSADYFALLEKQPALGAYLKLGNVVLVDGERVIEVRLPAK